MNFIIIIFLFLQGLHPRGMLYVQDLDSWKNKKLYVRYENIGRQRALICKKLKQE